MDLREIVADHQELAESILSSPEIIDREVQRQRIEGFLSHPNIVAILGVRRCGKTVLSLQLMNGRNFIYVNFDDERLYRIQQKDLNALLKAIYQIKEPEFIIFDEIQNVNGWELFLNRLRYDKKIIITGSNSNLLGSELATHLTGRHYDFTLFPFSFREHLVMKGEKREEYISTRERARILKEVNDYLLNGGMPERYKFGLEFVRVILSDILNKDVVAREKIRKIDDLERFFNFLMSSLSNEISLRNIRKMLNLHPTTVQKWFKAVVNAFLVIPVERFSFKAKEKLRSSRKLYVVDNGFYTSSAFRFSRNTGKLMENLVAIELLRRRAYWHNSQEIFYLKDAQQYEVDFVVKEGFKVKELIQVTYANDFDEINHREIRALLKAKEFLRCKNLTVVTWEYEDEREISWFGRKGRVKFIPLWKWLLRW